MKYDDDFDVMTDACIRAGQLVKDAGSPELLSAMRLVLFILGREISDRNPKLNDGDVIEEI